MNKVTAWAKLGVGGGDSRGPGSGGIEDKWLTVTQSASERGENTVEVDTGNETYRSTLILYIRKMGFNDIATYQGFDPEFKLGPRALSLSLYALFWSQTV